MQKFCRIHGCWYPPMYFIKVWSKVLDEYVDMEICNRHGR